MQSPDAPIEGEGFIQQKFVWESEDAGGSTPSTMGVEVKNHVATITA
jgi:hypothetical protein